MRTGLSTSPILPAQRHFLINTIKVSNYRREIPRLGGLVVLADYAAKDRPPPDWEVQRGGGLGVLVGRALLAGLAGPVPVVMVGVLAEYRLQVPFAVDEDPVDALGSCFAYPSLGVAVRPRRLRRVFTIFRPTLANISSKAPMNLASRSRMRKRNASVRSPRSMIKLRTC